jgi:hypothetical protein
MKLTTTHGVTTLLNLVEDEMPSSYIKGTHPLRNKDTIKNLLVGIPAPIVLITALTDGTHYIDSEFYNMMKDYFVSTEFALLPPKQSEALSSIDVFVVMASIRDMKIRTNSNIKKVAKVIQERMNEY